MHLLITKFHWGFSRCFLLLWMHVVGQRGTCLSCIACIQTSCTGILTRKFLRARTSTITKFHWCFSWCFLLDACCWSKRNHACPVSYAHVLAFSPGNFSMHVEQVGVSGRHFLSMVLVISWSSNWGNSYQLVCWTGESSHMFFWVWRWKLQCCQCPASS